MAYVDFSSPEALGASSSNSVGVDTAVLRLTGIQRTTVLLSRNDDASTLRPAPRHYKFKAWLFGNRRPNPLADIRLETLRRFSVAVAHDRTRIMEMTRIELRALRFTESQIDEAQALASQFRRPRSLMGLFCVALMAAVICGVYSFVQGYLEDASVALMVSLLLVLPLLAGLAPRSAR